MSHVLSLQLLPEENSAIGASCVSQHSCDSGVSSNAQTNDDLDFDL